MPVFDSSFTPEKLTMIVKKVELKDFRNLNIVNIELESGLNIFYGDNAQGKTNLLEAIYFCSTGRSQRTRSDRELISIGKSEAHIRAHIDNEGVSERIDVHLKNTQKKGIAINGLPIKFLGDLFGIFLTVIFSPEDLQLVKAGPSERRKYMDLELCQLSRVYYYNLQQYYRVLKQRNNLLKYAERTPDLKDTLPVWDEQLVSFGLKIMEYRSDFILNINQLSGKLHSSITNGKEKLNVVYKSNVSADNYMDKLVGALNRDLMLGSTTVGIHKDDIVFLIDGVDARIFGSQGQQRTVCLSSKLAEIELIRSKTGKSPVLLLDDVLSELDKNRQKHLIESMDHIQTIMTCTGNEDVLRKLSRNQRSLCYKIENGQIF